jgi:hypothetical protein
VHWFAGFLYLYALGTAGAGAVVPEKAIGRYYVKFNGLLVVGMLIAATLLGRPFFSPRAALGLCANVAAVAMLATSLLTLTVAYVARSPLRADLLLLPVSTGLMFAVFEAVSRAGINPAGLLLAVHLLTGAAVLGTSLVAMVLGHWYLQDASLSFDHLAGLTRAFVIACVAKLVVSGLCFARQADHFWPLVWEFDGIFLWTRLLGGGFFGLVLGLMAWSCAKSKSNQSATGILYVAVMFVLVGEVTSLYLTLGKNTWL